MVLEIVVPIVIVAWALMLALLERLFPYIDGYRVLRQLGPTNVSYLAPVGKGLTIQGGIFSSFIGYDSLYAKDNFNYTRPWGADFTPYFMLGVNASYPLTEKVTGTFFVVNGYWHLANANSVPSFGGQAAIAAAVKQAHVKLALREREKARGQVPSP